MRKFAEVTVGATFSASLSQLARQQLIVSPVAKYVSLVRLVLIVFLSYFTANVISAMPSFPTAVHLRSYSAHKAQIYARRSAAFSERKKTRCQNVS